jgi:hypothetical protein
VKWLGVDVKKFRTLGHESRLLKSDVLNAKLKTNRTR